MQRKFGGEQLPEIIYIDGILHSLYTTPLLPWLRERDMSAHFDRRTPNCERGYIGKWQIRDDTLWLIGFYAWHNNENVRLDDLFGAPDEVPAHWFTGPLVVEPASSEIPDGAKPKMSTLFVEAGRIVDR